MPVFVYRAKRGPEKAEEGELQADSRAAALDRIVSSGLTPVWVRDKSEQSSGIKGIRFKKRVRPRDITLFTRQLASLTKSGVPILNALSTVALQSESPEFRKVCLSMQSVVRDGSMLSDALSRFPDLFSMVYVNMVRAGESAGKLDVMLVRVAEAREKDDEIRRKVQSATAYPALVLIVGGLTLVMLFTFFLPKIITLFKDFDDLPLPTRIIIGMSSFFSSYWPWMAIGVVLVLLAFRRIRSSEKGRDRIDSLKLGLPLFGDFLLKHQMAVFSRTLSLLIDAGINLDRAIRLSAAGLSNSFLRKQLLYASDETVRQGAPFSEALKKVKAVPPMVVNMSAVGEQGGRLDEALAEVAGFYEAEIDQQARVVMTLIEPILILVVGGIVGFIVAAMVLPIFKLSVSL